MNLLQPQRRIHLHETLHEMAVSSSTIYLFMGLTALVGLPLLPPEFGCDLPLAYATAGAAMLSGLLFYLNRYQCSLAVSVFHMIIAVAMTTSALLALGPAQHAAAVSMIYILTALHAFHFFTLRAALGVVAYIAVSFALVASRYHWQGWGTFLVLLVGCCCTAGAVIDLLVRRLNCLATTDKLTGAYNRHTWDALFELKFNGARRYRYSLALMIIDLDRFKIINDTRGHQEGDRILRETAGVIRSCLRDSDIFARWGGDEFIILLDDCPLDQARNLEGRLRKALEQTISFSSGLAQLRQDDTPESFVFRADRHLLSRKKNRT